MTKFGSDKIRTFGSDEGRQRIQDRRERVAAIRGDEAPRGRGKRRASSESDTSETIELPTLEKLGRKLKRMDSADEIRAMQEQDDRKGAQELYETRLAELSGEGE